MTHWTETLTQDMWLMQDLEQSEFEISKGYVVRLLLEQNTKKNRKLLVTLELEICTATFAQNPMAIEYKSKPKLKAADQNNQNRISREYHSSIDLYVPLGVIFFEDLSDFLAAQPLF